MNEHGARGPATTPSPRPRLVARWLRRIGRALRPVFDPDFLEREARADALARAVKVADKRLTAQDTTLSQLVESLVDLRADTEGARQDATAQHERERDWTRASLRRLDAGILRQWSATSRLLRRSERADTWLLAEAGVGRRLGELRTGTGAIVVGPWTGEVGFEIMYWVPFVRWAVEKYRLDAKRLVIVSRGGTESWYGLAGARYIDALELITPETFREQSGATLKQRRVSALDRRLIRMARAKVPSAPMKVLHPGLMYALFFPVWKEQAPGRRIFDFARYRRINPPSLPEGLLHGVHPNYVAARFYFSKCFPDTAQNRQVVARVVASIASHRDVVWLSPGTQLDDHAEIDDTIPTGVHRLHLPQDPARNLAVQTAVIGAASGFVGTYGGFSYLGPFCGVDAVAFYSEANFFRHHLDLATRVFPEVHGGSLTALDVRRDGLLRVVFGA